MDQDTRRKKQKALMTELLERKIRMHAQHLYDQRGGAEDRALEDWVQAESEVLGSSILAPLYRKTRSANACAEDVREDDLASENPEFVKEDVNVSEVGA